MKIIVLLGLIPYLTAGILVGVRLLLLARQTRQFPETAMGLAWLLFALCYPATMAVRPLLGHDPTLLVVGVALSAAGLATSNTLIYFFTRRVFRPGASWALALSCLGALCGLTVVTGTTLTADPKALNLTWQAAATTNWSIAFGWMGIEAVLQWRMQARRRVIGLGDPVVANRFGMWGFSCLVTSIGTLALVVAPAVALDLTLEENLAGQAFAAVVGLIWSVVHVLTLMPPKRYMGWIRDRSLGASTGRP